MAKNSISITVEVGPEPLTSIRRVALFINKRLQIATNGVTVTQLAPYCRSNTRAANAINLMSVTGRDFLFCMQVWIIDALSNLTWRPAYGRLLTAL